MPGVRRADRRPATRPVATCGTLGPSGQPTRGGPHMTQTIPVTAVAQVGKDRVRVMTGLTVHAGGPYLCGPALTCACAPEDNLAMHAALYQAQSGAVLVCDGTGSTRCAMFGELMATDAANQRLA